MRKLFFLLLSTIIICNASAQKGWYIGGFGQLNASYILNQNSYNYPELGYETTIGYGGNLGIGWNFNSELGFQWNAGITKGGQKYADEFKISKNVWEKNYKDVDLTYFHTGILFRYSPIFSRQEYVDDPKLKMVIMVGPQFDFLTKANVVYERGGAEIGYPLPTPSLDYKAVSNDKELFQKFVVSGVVSLGIDYLVTEKFFLNAALRAEMGFNDINDKFYRRHDGYAASRIFNPGLQIGLGFYFTRD